MSIGMALVDYIPVILFLVSAILLQRTLYPLMSKGAFALLSCGTIMVFIAGFFKATWKLLYATNLCDFERLSQMFFPCQSVGFLLAGASVIALLFFPQEKPGRMNVLLLTPAVYSGTMLFVAGMILGVLGYCGGLAVLAARKKRTAACVLSLISFVLLLGMGYLSSKDFAQASMNWIAEGVNCAAQLCLLGAVCSLRKAL